MPRFPPDLSFELEARFHVEPDGETDLSQSRLTMGEFTSFEEGFLIGILVGEGHFGGDGKQPQVTLRMHVRHEKLFRWLQEKFPNSRVYGPYHHSGRHYYQWMARGQVLREELLPMLTRHLHLLDDHVRARIEEMCMLYRLPRPTETR